MATATNAKIEIETGQALSGAYAVMTDSGDHQIYTISGGTLTQDLPVATYPAVLPSGEGQHARGVVVHQRHVRDQRGAGIQAMRMEEGVAEWRASGLPVSHETSLIPNKEREMFFRQLLAKDATLSYFFGCASCHVSVAVDPVLGDEQWFIDEAARQDVKITHVIDTHVHADHYSGGRALAEKTGAKYCLHESNSGRVTYAFEPLKDGQRIDVGNVYTSM